MRPAGGQRLDVAGREAAGQATAQPNGFARRITAGADRQWSSRLGFGRLSLTPGPLFQKPHGLTDIEPIGFERKQRV